MNANVNKMANPFMTQTERMIQEMEHQGESVFGNMLRSTGDFHNLERSGMKGLGDAEREVAEALSFSERWMRRLTDFGLSPLLLSIIAISSMILLKDRKIAGTIVGSLLILLVMFGFFTRFRRR